MQAVRFLSLLAKTPENLTALFSPPQKTQTPNFRFGLLFNFVITKNQYIYLTILSVLRCTLLHFYRLIFTRGTTMQHRDLYPHEILQDVIDKSYAKSEGHLKTLAILSF